MPEEIGHQKLNVRENQQSIINMGEKFSIIVKITYRSKHTRENEWQRKVNMASQRKFPCHN